MVLTTLKSAEMLNVSYITVMRWIYAGKLQSATKVGRDWLIDGWEIAELREKLVNSGKSYYCASVKI